MRQLYLQQVVFMWIFGQKFFWSKVHSYYGYYLSCTVSPFFARYQITLFFCNVGTNNLQKFYMHLLVELVIFRVQVRGPIFKKS